MDGNVISVGEGNDAVFRSNVFRPGSAVVGSGVQCAPTYRDEAARDYHLAATDTCARGRGDGSSHPPSDADGEPRPQGLVDAGADEIP